jgi:hypothetical protein
MCTSRQNEEFTQKVGSEISECKDAGLSWRIVLKWNLERWGLNVAIELKGHAL